MAMTIQSLLCSCGSCGYELNLSSCNRNTSTIGSKYGKSIKRGIISFFNIDESRFTQVDEIQCIPYFSKNSWGLFRRRTKLLCRKCGNDIGIAYNDLTSSQRLVSDVSDSSSGNEVSSCRKYNVKIRALQPSSSEESATQIYTWCTRASLFYMLFFPSRKHLQHQKGKNSSKGVFLLYLVGVLPFLSMLLLVHNGFQNCFIRKLLFELKGVLVEKILCKHFSTAKLRKWCDMFQRLNDWFEFAGASVLLVFAYTCVHVGCEN